MGNPTLQRSLELLSRFPLRGQYRLGDLVGLVLRNTSSQVSRQTRENIGLCFADMDRAEQQTLYRDCMRHTCYAITELAAVWCWPVERVLATITSVDVCEEFDSSERSRIILLPHLSSWETFEVWLVLVPTRKRGLRQLLIGLKAGKSLVILPDQKPGGKKAYINSRFFGYSAPATTLVQNPCRKIDCEVFIANMCRSEPPGEFSLQIRPLEHARLAADEISSAQYMNDQIEALARQHLAQYQWGYRRFDAGAYASAK
ncbi:MAG: hypothetical protein GY896_02110 [Gammaproteobacteria bacterium]|nr:hypothetical protein [Gammaproteobacteria bacterium]